jgi:uncharacterized protein
VALDSDRIHVIADEAELREVIGSPAETVLLKLSDRVNGLTQQFIERSPFVCVATVDPEGGLDVSPRGDPAGFVRVLDERTLLVPERPGNRIADTLRNLLADPRIALLFMIPGIGNTLRINGRAEIVVDPELCASFSVHGKTPKCVLVVTAERVYTQCPKALVRSRLWSPETQIARSELPSAGEMLAEISKGAIDAEEYDKAYPQRLKETIY